MNPNTNSAARQHAEKVCDVLNQSFGYRMALESLLAAQGVDVETIKAMSRLARDRQFDSFNALLNSAGRTTS